MFGAEFWVAIAFLILMGVFGYVGVHRTILKALDRYPFGCSEQITSRAMPLLYVNDLAAENHLALDAGVDQRIKDAIDRLLARQGSNGSFGLWSAGGDDAWLDLRRHLDEPAALEFLMLVGHYEMLATTINTLRVPLDRPRRARGGSVSR